MKTARKSSLNKKELRNWMNFYHDKWIECHNKLVNIKEIVKNKKEEK